MAIHVSHTARTSSPKLKIQLLNGSGLVFTAARALGASSTRMLLRHLLPNTFSSIIVMSTLQVAQAILAEAALSFLGVGTGSVGSGLVGLDGVLGLLSGSPRCRSSFHWRNAMTNQTQRIRALNDDLRQHLIGGGAVITLGVAALGEEAVDVAVGVLGREARVVVQMPV